MQEICIVALWLTLLERHQVRKKDGVPLLLPHHVWDWLKNRHIATHTHSSRLGFGRRTPASECTLVRFQKNEAASACSHVLPQGASGRVLSMFETRAVILGIVAVAGPAMEEHAKTATLLKTQGRFVDWRRAMALSDRTAHTTCGAAGLAELTDLR